MAMPQLARQKDLDALAARVSTGGAGTNHRARRHKTNEQTIGQALAAVPITLQAADTVQGIHVETVADGVRARVDGVYLVSATCWVSNAITGWKNILLMVDGVNVREFAVDSSPGRGSGADTLFLKAGQTVTMAAYFQNAGAIIKGAGEKDTGITMAYVPPAAGGDAGGGTGAVGADTEHRGDFANPHRVTKAQVGLGSVTNTPQVATGTPGMTLDYGPVLPPAGQAGRFFFLVAQ